VYLQPGVVGLTLLSIRNLSLLAITAALAVWCLREVRGAHGTAAPA
jgi:hypothetical protein